MTAIVELDVEYSVEKFSACLVFIFLGHGFAFDELQNLLVVTAGAATLGVAAPWLWCH